LRRRPHGSYRFFVSLLLRQRQSETKVQLVPLWFEFNGPAKLINGFSKSACVIKWPTDFLDRYEGEWVERLRTAMSGNRFVASAGILK
jgi:hypothetical protein